MDVQQDQIRLLLAQRNALDAAIEKYKAMNIDLNMGIERSNRFFRERAEALNSYSVARDQVVALKLHQVDLEQKVVRLNRENLQLLEAAYPFNDEEEEKADQPQMQVDLVRSHISNVGCSNVTNNYHYN